jgi:hypothetical protein
MVNITFTSMMLLSILELEKKGLKLDKILSIYVIDMPQKYGDIQLLLIDFTLTTTYNIHWFLDCFL